MHLWQIAQLSRFFQNSLRGKKIDAIYITFCSLFFVIMFFTHYKNECQCQIKAFGISLLTWWREERSYFGRHNFCGRNLLHFGNTIFWKVTAIIKINRSLIYNGKFWSIRNKIKFIQIQCPPLNRITLGQHKSDNNTVTEWFN